MYILMDLRYLAAPKSRALSVAASTQDLYARNAEGTHLRPYTRLVIRWGSRKWFGLSGYIV